MAQFRGEGGADIQLMENPFEGQPPIGGRFEVVSEVGGGPLGRVYLGEDKKGGGRVAIKVLHPRESPNLEDPTCLNRYRKAARDAMRVSSPYVARVLAVEQVSLEGTERVAIITEHVSAPTLDRWLARNGKLDIEQVAYLVDSMAAGVQAGHEAGVLHLDLHPGNVFLTSPGDIRVTDFLIRRAFLDDIDVNVPEGSDYHAPEVRTGGPTDPSTDVFSLGQLLIHVVTGKDPADVRMRDLPDVIADLIEEATEPNPDERIADVPAFRDALKQLVSGDAPESMKGTQQRPSDRVVTSPGPTLGELPAPSLGEFGPPPLEQVKPHARELAPPPLSKPKPALPSISDVNAAPKASGRKASGLSQRPSDVVGDGMEPNATRPAPLKPQRRNTSAARSPTGGAPLALVGVLVLGCFIVAVLLFLLLG